MYTVLQCWITKGRSYQYRTCTIQLHPYRYRYVYVQHTPNDAYIHVKGNSDMLLVCTVPVAISTSNDTLSILKRYWYRFLFELFYITLQIDTAKVDTGPSASNNHGDFPSSPDWPAEESWLVSIVVTVDSSAATFTNVVDFLGDLVSVAVGNDTPLSRSGKSLTQALVASLNAASSKRTNGGVS